MQQEYQIKYLRAAMRDLEGIAQLYLGLAGADSAEKFIDEILHTVDLLRTFPYSGALHPDMVLAEREFRKVICRDYVCVYKVIDSEKTVYIYLRDRADASGVCWPGIKTIAGELGLSPRTVQRALADLEHRQLIEKRQRHRANGSLTSNLYRLTAAKKSQSPAKGGL